MEANPGLVGQLGIGWMFDPALGRLAPHLAASIEGRRAIGACEFKIGVNERATEFALRTSETRRRLYAEGQYVPTEWASITKRPLLVKWAHAYRARSHDQPGGAP